jgi:nitroreductase
VPGARVKLRTLSRLREYALALPAWKQAGGTRWARRVNPSSGNLHPTEGQVLVGGIAAPGEGPGLFHYAPAEHGLGRRIVQGGIGVKPCIHGQFPGIRACAARRLSAEGLIKEDERDLACARLAR